MANAGAVSKAIKRLEDHGLIYEMDGEHRFGDSFFRQWILGIM
jgi:DNA-binding MarR family transcriptional regulator